jgi:peptidoglycan-associated lipoprotein
MSFLRSLALALASVVVVIVAAGCPGPEYPKCEKDDHCKKGKDGKAINEYCLFGQCQQCAKDSHCTAGEKCNRGRCEETCISDEQCGTGKMCEASSCVPVECSDTQPCSGSMVCQAGRCAAATTGNNTTGNGETLNCSKRQTVLFDFNVSDLRSDARQVLDTLAKCMTRSADWQLTVEGHADDRGTTEYNLQLGDRRAGSVKEYLVRLGVPKNRVKAISYGEEKPVDHSGTEEGWTRNRRGELVVQ